MRKRKHYEDDLTNLTLAQVIVVGIIGALIFVLALVALVTYITR